MEEAKTYTISTITRGMCLESRPTGIFTNRYDESGKTREQLWTIEQGDDGTSIAFRSVVNGQYLRSAGKGDGAKAQTGAKMWWIMEPGDSPWSWWLRSKDFGNYLCNYYGYQTPNNKVWMWSSNLSGWNYTMMWYVSDAKAVSSFVIPDGSDTAASSKHKGDLDAREEALKKREISFESREKELSDREAHAKKNTENTETREKAIAEREEKLELREKEASSKEALVKKQKSEANNREKAINEREKTFQARELTAAPITNQSDELAATQRQLKDAQKKLETAKAAEQKLAAREAELSSREEKMTENAKSHETGDHGLTNGSPEFDARDRSKNDEEIARLRQRVHDLEAQLSGHSQSHSAAASVPSVPSNRPDLNPLVIQRDFEFLSRLDTSHERGPLKPLLSTTVS